MINKIIAFIGPLSLALLTVLAATQSNKDIPKNIHQGLDTIPISTVTELEYYPEEKGEFYFFELDDKLCFKSSNYAVVYTDSIGNKTKHYYSAPNEDSARAYYSRYVEENRFY